jgi:hypothetical protein
VPHCGNARVQSAVRLAEASCYQLPDALQNSVLLLRKHCLHGARYLDELCFSSRLRAANAVCAGCECSARRSRYAAHSLRHVSHRSCQLRLLL